jgi:hypothetical protein
MLIAERIRKLGFHRWYERQLIEAHASLVTALLCVIVVAVCLDQLRWQDGGFKAIAMMALSAAAALLCIKTVAIYFRVLFRAEHVAQQANCAHCGAYGALAITEHSRAGADEEWLRARCRKCGHEWTVEMKETAEASRA